MNTKDILTDFTIYLLLLGDEFRNDELQFFDKNTKEEASYNNYLLAINNLVDVESFHWDSDLESPILKVKTLNDIISEKEIEFLQDYIKNEFDFGYPNEINEDGFPWGETLQLDFTIEEIKYHFKDYVELRKSNTLHYITYYQQFLNYLYEHVKISIEATKSNIDNFYTNRNSLDVSLFSELTDELKSELKKKLLKSTQNTLFQVQGGFDDFGFILNFKDTLKSILELNNSKYSELNLDIKPKQYFALAEYEYYLFKIEGKNIFTKTEVQKNLQKEFISLKEKNAEQIQFLKNKDFNSTEIDIILNCFSLNKFSALNIRSIQNLKGVLFFRMVYLFFRFEFLKENNKLFFDKEHYFKKLPLTSEISNSDCNQFKKYYDRVENVVDENKSERHHPFDSIDVTRKLLKKIKNELYIDLNKLNIPTYFKKYM